MTHADQDELTLHYYGESDARVVDHLADCEECRASYQLLQRVLNSVDGLPVPERPADYEERIWKSISPKLDRRRRRTFFGLNASWFAWPRLAPIAATAVLL